MPVKAYWQDETQTIVRYDFEGNWTWDEFYPEYQKAIAMERAVPHRVDVIVDVLRSGRLPLNVLTHLKNIADKQPPNLGLSVIVTTNQFVRSLYQAGCRFYPRIRRYFAVAASMEDANARIAEQRQSPGVEPPAPHSDA